MALVYGVTPAAIAAEFPTLFPEGFGSATTPTVVVVQSWIEAADVIVALHVQRAAAKAPSSTDQAVPLARRYVVAMTKAEVVRAIYTGNDPEKVEQAAAPFARQAKELLAEIDALGEQMTGEGTVVSRVRASATTDGEVARELLVTDAMLDGGAARERRY